jgi:hypothetical protein
MSRVLGPLVFMALLWPSSGSAQQPQRPADPRADTARVEQPQQSPQDTAAVPPEQRALDRLRGLQRVGQADTVQAPVDTVRAQQVDMTAARPPVAAPPSQIQRDSIMRLLLAGVPGYIGTEYQGDTVRFETDLGRLELRGDPQVAREGNQLVADSLIVYDERIARACGYGSPVLHAVGMTHPMASDTVCFDVQRQVGWARGAQTTFAEGATWNLRGETLVIDGDDYYSHRAIFTDCDLPWPHQHYHFGAREVKVVRDNVLVARDVTLNFSDVPVFWLPFMVQSLSQGRRSGLLMPRFSINDIVRQSARYSRRLEDVGFYWAISEYLGAELAFDWFSDNWTGLRGSFDYNFNDRFLRGGLTYRQFWMEDGSRNFTLTSSNSWQMDERTNVSLNANYTTSSRFVQQRSIDPRELNRTIDSQGGFRRRFDWGNLNLSAARSQNLHTTAVDLKLPSTSLQINPITLFEADPGAERWYSNATLSLGTISFDNRMLQYGADAPNRTAQTSRRMATSMGTGLGLGRLSWSQSFGFEENRLDERVVSPDTILPPSQQQQGRWSTSLSFQQRLVGTSTLTPAVSMSGNFLRNDSTGQRTLSAPTRVDFSASTRMELFGFWPGVAGFERFRHRVSPGLSYNYSPAARADSLQQRIFRTEGIGEQNRLSLTLSQTFEGKRRAEVTEAADTAAAADTVPGAPRRRTEVAPLMLLSISTSALVYDFVNARERGEGLTTTTLSNNIQSDLIRGLQLSISHDLFRTTRADTAGLPPGSIPLTQRSFSPYLRTVNTSFSLNSGSWLFRLLGLGREDSEPDTGGADPLQEDDPMGAGPAVDRTRSDHGLLGTSRRGSPLSGRRGDVGTWNANFTYSLSRPPRDAPPEARANQMLTVGASFQPTEMWSVRWDTGYSFTSGDFTDHILTLTRTMHDWDANFDFVKAQNGNFSFQFRVHLRANPDIKVDYHQTDTQAGQF